MRLRPRLSYANVVSTLCLFIVLGGSATAAVLITGKQVKDSSLTGVDVRSSSLTGSDLKNNSVGSLDIKDGDLLASDFKPGQLAAGASGAQGPKGETGATGSTGNTGAPGTVGSPGVSGYERKVSPTIFMGAETELLGSVTCPVGKSVLGGGVEGTQNTPGTLTVSASYPGSSPREWKARVHYTGANGANEGFIVYALCGVVG